MNVVIIGGSGGIGHAFVDTLLTRSEIDQVHATYNRNPPQTSHAKLAWSQLDISDESSISDWACKIGEIDWLINAAGLLHTAKHGPEKTIRQLDPEFFLDNLKVNTLPALLLAKHLHTKFRHRRPAIFATLSARVGSIEDNYLGGWFSYRASKAALNMGLKTLAIEWQRTLPNVTVAALHPGTTDTALSKPFQRHVPADQLFSPAQSVGYMLDVLARLTPADSGRMWAFDGELLPW